MRGLWRCRLHGDNDTSRTISSRHGLRRTSREERNALAASRHDPCPRRRIMVKLGRATLWLDRPKSMRLSFACRTPITGQIEIGRRIERLVDPTRAQLGQVSPSRGASDEDHVARRPRHFVPPGSYDETHYGRGVPRSRNRPDSARAAGIHRRDRDFDVLSENGSGCLHSSRGTHIVAVVSPVHIAGRNVATDRLVRERCSFARAAWMYEV